MTHHRTRISRFSAATAAALSLALASALPAGAQPTPAGGPKVLGNAVVHGPTHFDVSPPLGAMATQFAPRRPAHMLAHPPLPPKLNRLNAPAGPSAPHAGVQPGVPGAGPFSTFASPLVGATVGLSFEGIGNTSYLNCPSVSGFYVAPPDTNAAVGDTQVVEWVNLCYAVFNKATGALVAGPFAGTNFWAGFGPPCENNNDGDPVIQWDKKNHRWVASQNVFNGPPYYTCVAVSKTADATGAYYRYAFPQPGFPDYPKWGLKPNVYYQTQNDFGNTGYEGVNVCAYQATLMRQGNPKAKQVCVLDDSNGTLFDDSMLPADSDGAPAPNGPEVLLGSIDNFFPGDTHVYEYVFKVDFAQPSHSTLAGVDGSMPISVPAFAMPLCTPYGYYTFTCVQQPDTPDRLDTLGDRLMYRLAEYFSHGRSHYVVTQTVGNTSAVAVRWYEFQARGNTTRLSLYQWGQTPDDGEYRWMGSAAMDRAGDIAVGYSRSSAQAGDYPSIYYAGHTAGEPLGATDAEALILQGTGSQIDTGGRWGDYSSMALDGADSCTFWYAQEYYPQTGYFVWGTWLASLRFPNCP